MKTNLPFPVAPERVSVWAWWIARKGRTIHRGKVRLVRGYEDRDLNALSSLLFPLAARGFQVVITHGSRGRFETLRLHQVLEKFCETWPAAREYLLWCQGRIKR